MKNNEEEKVDALCDYLMTKDYILNTIRAWRNEGLSDEDIAWRLSELACKIMLQHHSVH